MKLHVGEALYPDHLSARTLYVLSLISEGIRKGMPVTHQDLAKAISATHGGINWHLRPACTFRRIT